MVFRIFFITLFSLLFGSATYALPAKQTTGTMSLGQVSVYKPFTYYAAAAYCKPAQTKVWSCGNCKSNPTFKVISSGGDGSSVQYWYVGYDPTLMTIIVGHQGTDPSKFNAVLTDLNIFRKRINWNRFFTLGRRPKVHQGFADEHAKTADMIFKGVQMGMKLYKTKKVTVVGHSLGAAIALLDGVFLQKAISGLHIHVIGYGMPRVGNKAFADYVDKNLQVSRINNKNDPVPIIPGHSLMGFTHVSGEKRIQADGSWVVCTGQDNSAKSCSAGALKNPLAAKIADHGGPYDGVQIGNAKGC